ncbi:hypothetical protein AB0J83_16655 [Actinoplanes sp. NPDC049596]|uniref:hypothetical protein n=1 Tax=unclassified Actinoplanes TaxID=2626549 RepID=UPI00341BCC16
MKIRHNRDFAKYWVASVISAAGSRLTYVAMPVLVFALTGSPFLTGLVVAFEARPWSASWPPAWPGCCSR